MRFAPSSQVEDCSNKAIIRLATTVWELILVSYPLVSEDISWWAAAGFQVKIGPHGSPKLF